MMDLPLVDELMKFRFDDVPDEHRARIFGVPYVRLSLEDAGELFVTRAGWCRLPAILPGSWFLGRRYAREGERLPGGTGNVYGVDTPAPTKPNLKLVVKFARSGQDVPLHVEGTFPADIPDEEIRNARWNSPFEEFGLLHDLRRGRFGPPELTIRTKRALAIFCPPNEYKKWQLGRNDHLWEQMDSALEHAQEIAVGEPIHLHASRIYIMLFEWVEGENAEDCWKEGWIGEDEMKALTERVVGELEDKGFRVLDNKPRHFILRPLGNGQLMRRDGELVYTLIDFELLKRVPTYEAWLTARRDAVT